MSDAAKRGRPWSWGIIIVIGLFMAGTLGFVYFATTQKVDLVEQQYYEKTVAYDSVMASQAKGAESAGLALVFETDSVVIVRPDGLQVETVKLEGYRPSDGGMDCTYEVTFESATRFAIANAGFKSGFWRMRLSWMQAGEAASREYTWTAP